MGIGDGVLRSSLFPPFDSGGDGGGTPEHRGQRADRRQGEWGGGPVQNLDPRARKPGAGQPCRRLAADRRRGGRGGVAGGRCKGWGVRWGGLRWGLGWVDGVGGGGGGVGWVGGVGV